MLQVGSLLDNKYKILSEIGHGGMSVVYLAINERANKTWAVKEIRKDGVCDFEAVKQGLVVETDMLKRLNHDYLPSIIDVIDTDDSFLIVMDYIEGKSLQSVLKNGGAQPQEQVIKWGIQLCDVLGYLHSRTPAIIYRDMKPANVMLKPSGDITLIDFGTAREFKNRAMVEDTTCLGTRGYAAPEQFGGRGQTDARTDIYCLGATLYHLITGHSPAEPPYEIKPLSYWNPAYAGSGLEYIINKCCQQDPSQRYQSCAELMYDLEHVNDMDYTTLRKRRNKWTAFVASCVLCAIGVVGMIGFSLAKNSAMTETYDAYLSDAALLTSNKDFWTPNDGDSENSFVEWVLKAAKLEPGRYEAYDALLTRIEEDGKFDTQTELSAITKLLQEYGESGNQKNEAALLSEDEEGYADIQYRIGCLRFLMGSEQDSELADAVPHFENALNKGGMAQSSDPEIMNKARIAEALKTIGEEIQRLDSAKSMYTSDYSYSDLWDDLQGLITNNSIDSMGNRAYGLALYKRVAYMISDHWDDFMSVSVTAEEMNTLLTQIETALTNTELTENEISRGLGDLRQDGLDNVNTAKNRIAARSNGGAG